MYIYDYLIYIIFILNKYIQINLLSPYYVLGFVIYTSKALRFQSLKIQIKGGYYY